MLVIPIKHSRYLDKFSYAFRTATHDSTGKDPSGVISGQKFAKRA